MRPKQKLTHPSHRIVRTSEMKILVGYTLIEKEKAKYKKYVIHMMWLDGQDSDGKNGMHM